MDFFLFWKYSSLDWSGPANHTFCTKKMNKSQVSNVRVGRTDNVRMWGERERDERMRMQIRKEKYKD